MITKRDLILDAMQKIMTEHKAANATVNDVAKTAGIAKGSVYYYFDSKDQIITAVIERAYSKVISDSRKMLKDSKMNAIDKLKAIFNMSVYPASGHGQSKLLNLLSLQNDVLVHQKFCIIATRELTPILTEVIEQGIDEGVLECDYPRQYAQFILSMILLSLDSVLIPTGRDEMKIKLKALAQILETSMKAKKGSFSYLYTLPEDEDLNNCESLFIDRLSNKN